MTALTPELFRHFPELRERVPWAPLARATPVHTLARLQSYLHGPPIWIKRDDRTSDVHGGCKARKLEFAFGDILRRGARRVLAFGTVGSQYTLAVASFARHFNLQPLLGLVGRPSSAHSQRTLQTEHELGAELYRLDAGPRGLWKLGRSLYGPGGLPYVLWPRRAALFGTLGYVNAAFELKRQTNCGILPLPERIYISCGSGAVLAGLALGCELAQLPTRLVAVAAPGSHLRPSRALASEAAHFLRSRLRRFPPFRSFQRVEIEVRKEFRSGAASLGPQQAQALVRDLEGLHLDPTFTSRAVAALIADVRQGRLRGPAIVWHTHGDNVFARHPRPASVGIPNEFREFFVAP